jgi:hypothetical protein
MPTAVAVMTPPPSPHATFSPQGITIPVEPILRMQGYRNMERVRADVRRIAETAAASAEGLLAPVAYYRRVSIVSCTEASLTLDPGLMFKSQEFGKVLSGCSEVVIFVLTLGEGVDDETLRLIEAEEIVEALFVETAGWYAIEKATRAFAEHLWSVARADGYRLTRRLGPGYFDWHLAEQRDFFALFDGIDLPVRLLESCAMLPKKSRSGLYGLEPAS